jgi:arginase
VIRYFSVPYDSGQKGLRMGAGPSRLLAALHVEAEEVAPETDFRAEIRTTFELYRALAERVHDTVAAGDFPVVLSGNCGAAIGAAAGVGCDDLALIWFDAHGDYNTPETTDTGFLDGMGMAILNGRCWRTLAGSIPHFAPLDPTLTMHVGARDYSPGEREALLADKVHVIAPSSLDTVASSLDAMRRGAKRILIHVDLDVIDPQYGRANPYAADGGLSPDDVLRVIELAAQRFTIAGLGLASYDPAQDPDGRIAEIGANIIRATAH